MNEVFDNELMLEDRLQVIRNAQQKYDLENNSYISFSGGKDSTVLHYLIDMALPNNKIPRVFINTGIEYLDIVGFVKELAKTDNRVVIVQPTKNIKQTLEEHGYPFKSKEHSNKMWRFNSQGITPYIDRYLKGINYDGTPTTFACPEKLKYQFYEKMPFKISDRCCFKMKKEPAHQWAKENKKKTTITGMKSDEKGQRTHITCVVNDGEKFHPLVPVSDEWEDWFIQRQGIKLCKLYYPPFNFERTGCKGCPFALKLQEQLDLMAIYMPNEKAQCEMIWKPVYEEYRRLGYRLRKENGQQSLF